jgi:hypothetical protein
MTKERIKKLQILGFVFFNPRLKKNKYLELQVGSESTSQAMSTIRYPKDQIF